MKRSLTGLVCTCMLAFAGGVLAEEAEKELVDAEDPSLVSTEFSLAFDSKLLSYGLVDNNEGILTPCASITFFDWLSFECSSLFDISDYGHKAGYGNRSWRYQELDPATSIGHAFGPDDAAWLPTTVELSLEYQYEYHPRCTAIDDMQYFRFGLALPDLWLEPILEIERETKLDEGTYVNLDLGHTFEICDGVSVRPGVAQGFGNACRVRGYLTHPYTDEPLDHAGLMNTFVKAELEWTVTENLTLGACLGYSDFIFDRKIREAARAYEACGDWKESWNFVGGFSVALSF